MKILFGIVCLLAMCNFSISAPNSKGTSISENSKVELNRETRQIAGFDTLSSSKRNKHKMFHKFNLHENF